MSELVLARRTLTDEEARDRVLEYHRLTMDGAAEIIRVVHRTREFMYLCGAVLLVKKAEVGHGNFMLWRRKNLPGLADRTATNYANFTRAIAARCPAIHGCTLALLDNPKDEAALAELSGLLAMLTDVEAIQEVVCKTAPRQITNGERKPATPPDQSKTLELRQKQALRDWHHLESSFRGYGDAFILYRRADGSYDDLQVQSELALLERHAQARKEWLRTPPAKRDPQSVMKLLEDK